VKSLENTRKPELARRKVIQSYDHPLVRIYSIIRFIIMNKRIMKPIQAFLPPRGTILDSGCGFGQFSLYLALTEPERRILSFDISPWRIDIAKTSARRLEIKDRVRFECCNITKYNFKEKVDAIMTLDLLHHVTPIAIDSILSSFHRIINDEGVLLIKDIETWPPHKVAFTWLLDKAMDFRAPVNYFSRKRMIALLEYHGFVVKTCPIRDILPYSHILYVCRKRL